MGKLQLMFVSEENWGCGWGVYLESNVIDVRSSAEQLLLKPKAIFSAYVKTGVIRIF